MRFECSETIEAKILFEQIDQFAALNSHYSMSGTVVCLVTGCSMTTVLLVFRHQLLVQNNIQLLYLT